MNHYEQEKTYLDFGGDYVYIDFDEITNVIKLEPPKEEGKESEEEDEMTPPSQFGNITIDVVKWEMINKMIDTILDDLSEEDPTMGRKNLDKLPVSFKIAYNTLLNYNIIKIVEE
jgi:hypothetical protein